MFTHDETKTYICESCGVRFAKQRLLDKHVESNHVLRSSNKDPTSDSVGNPENKKISENANTYETVLTDINGHSGDKRSKLNKELRDNGYYLASNAENNAENEGMSTTHATSTCDAAPLDNNTHSVMPHDSLPVSARPRNGLKKDHSDIVMNDGPETSNHRGLGQNFSSETMPDGYCRQQKSPEFQKKQHCATLKGQPSSKVQTKGSCMEVPSVIKCDRCRKTFKSERLLYSHEVLIHKIPSQYYCRFCDKYLPFAGNLKSHVLFHEGLRYFECEQCGKRLRSNAHLKEHLRVHTGDRPFQCELCGKAFKQSGTFRKHLRDHTHCEFEGTQESLGNKDAKSKERRKDNNSQSITTVNQKHGKVLVTDGASACNQTPVHTNICNTFTPDDLDNLATGKQKQYGAEPVMSDHLENPCGTECRETLSLKSTNNNKFTQNDGPETSNHRRLGQNFSSETMPDGYCRQQKSPKFQKKQHCAALKGQPSSKVQTKGSCMEVPSVIKCDRCCKTFKSERLLYSHEVLIHKIPSQYYCRSCDKYLPFAGNLKSHLLFHEGLRYFECEQCGKRLRSNAHLKEHLRVHTGDRPFQCELCGKTFKQSGTFRKHLRDHTHCEFEGTQESLGNKDAKSKERCKDNNSQSITIVSQKHGKVLVTDGTSACNQTPVHTNICNTSTPYDLDNLATGKQKQYGAEPVMSDHLENPCGTECRETLSSKSTNNNKFTELRQSPKSKKMLPNALLKEHSASNLHGKEEVGNSSVPSDFECSNCKTLFQSERRLFSHQVLVHKKPTQYYCQSCKKYLPYASTLRAHVLVHEGIKYSECKYCSKRFRSNAHLKEHLRIHSGDKPFVCELCGSKFAQKSALKTHLTTHAREKPYVCKICCKGFSQSSNFKRHTKMHHPTDTGHKLFSCELCSRKFRRISTLEKHSRTHSDGEKKSSKDWVEDKHSQSSHGLKDTDPSNSTADNQTSNEMVVRNANMSSCPALAKINTHETAILNNLPNSGSIENKEHDIKEDRMMNNHVETINCREFEEPLSSKDNHLDKNSEIEGESCSEPTKRQSTSKVYLEKNGRVSPSAGIFKCRKCQKLFKNERLLFSHKVLVHKTPTQYYCQSCKKYLPFASNLTSHILFHEGIKYFECKYCKKRFRSNSHLKVHLRTHTGNKQYTCELCDSKFIYNNNLIMHMKTHTDGKNNSPLESVADKHMQPNYAVKGSNAPSSMVKTHKNNEISCMDVSARCNLGPGNRKTQDATKLDELCNSATFKHKDNGIGKEGMISNYLENPNNTKFDKTSSKSILNNANQLKKNPQVKRKPGSTPSKRQLPLKPRVNVKGGKQLHSTSSQTECSKCQKLFRNQTTLFGHQVLIHKMPSKYYCQTCKKYLPFANNLKSHVLFHQGIKYFECEYCKKRLRSKAHLQEHLRIHTGEKPFGCELCGKKFTQRSALKAHMKNCIGCESRIKQLLVQVARVDLNPGIANDDLIVTTTSNYKDNEMSSTDGTTACDPVPVDLSTQASLNGADQQSSATVKSMEHATEKLTVERDRLSTPQSSELSERSSSKSMLNKYIRQQKSSTIKRKSGIAQAKEQRALKFRGRFGGPSISNAIACDKCQQVFKTEHLLLKHQVLVHKKRTKYYCDNCKKYLPSARTLKTHILFHEGIKFFECEHCKRRFMSNAHLQDHLRIHTGDKPFVCELCGSKFRQGSALKMHLRIHTGERPHECNICGKGFRQSSCFHSHMRKHHL